MKVTIEHDGSKVHFEIEQHDSGLMHSIKDLKSFAKESAFEMLYQLRPDIRRRED